MKKDNCVSMIKLSPYRIIAVVSNVGFNFNTTVSVTEWEGFAWLIYLLQDLLHMRRTGLFHRPATRQMHERSPVKRLENICMSSHMNIISYS